ncbi:MULTISPECIES: hypothetical protein [unclassified Sphingomonas]|uniref:hypothetical protein n=1 Tax=unclassified Sphingomonas TaxID=196159 RepID=UPI001F5791C3|nr:MULTISPECIES: hypothetical protein [unclassified Sphingomonas]
MTTAVSGTSDKIEAMANVMVETFGARALGVAQAQVEAATPDQPSVAETWQQIVGLIGARLAAPPETSR